MIYLTTGQPGAGKTLLTLAEVRARAERENRVVYYAGIEILKPEMFPGWVELEDPAKWYELPDGAIIVHDECQTLYRPRGTGAQVPKHVAEYETHRHKGYDVYLITQHPMLIDSNIRRLTGEHRHVVRAFGAKVATVHRWGQVKEQCDKTRGDSERETRSYPRELFDAYKSATVHTHQRRLPKALIFLFFAPVIFGAVVWAAVVWIRANYLSEPEPKVETPVTQSVAGAVVRTASGGGPTLERGDWFQERTPRIAGLPHTAPRYDQITLPVHVPHPAACVEWQGKGCRCFTDQATRIDVGDTVCRDIVRYGYYVDWDTVKGRNDENGVGVRSGGGGRHSAGAIGFQEFGNAPATMRAAAR